MIARILVLRGGKRYALCRVSGHFFFLYLDTVRISRAVSGITRYLVIISIIIDLHPVWLRSLLRENELFGGVEFLVLLH